MRRLAPLAAACALLAAAAALPAAAGERAAAFMPPPGQWALVPGSALSESGVQVDKATAQRLHIAGSKDAQAAGDDNGAAWDPESRCLLFMGGGRRYWGGNEVYRLCLGDLRWQRLTEPTPLPAGGPPCPAVADAPAAGLAWDGLEVAEGRLYAFLTDAFCRSGTRSIDTAWSLDLAAPQAGWRPEPGAPRRFAGAAVARNPRTGGLVVVGTERDVLAEMDPAATLPATEIPIGATSPAPGMVCTAAGDDVYCLSGGRALWRLEYGPGQRADRLRELGDVPLGAVGPSPCVVWHPARQRLVVLGGARTVYEVDPADRSVTRWPNPEGPEPGDKPLRVVSKCAYVADLDAVVLVRGRHDPVAFYRLPAPGTTQRAPVEERAPAYVRGLPVPDPAGG